VEALEAALGEVLALCDPAHLDVALDQRAGDPALAELSTPSAAPIRPPPTMAT
jgi:hypothetical protein